MVFAGMGGSSLFLVAVFGRMSSLQTCFYKIPAVYKLPQIWHTSFRLQWGCSPVFCCFSLVRSNLFAASRALCRHFACLSANLSQNKHLSWNFIVCLPFGDYGVVFGFPSLFIVVTWWKSWALAAWVYLLYCWLLWRKKFHFVGTSVHFIAIH